MSEARVEIIDVLYDVASALRYLADSFRDNDQYGPSKLLRSLGDEVSDAAGQMEHEAWEPTKQFPKEEKGPILRKEIKGDEEAIQDLRAVFAEDEEIAAFVKGLIESARNALEERRAAAA